jgi:hypothetical protein
MTRRTISAMALWLVLAPALLCGAGFVLRPGAWRPRAQTELITHTVYAYRQWQSTGLILNAGESIVVRASGQWQYSPLIGLNGPEGGSGYAAPSYPLTHAPGGSLIGRIGDEGDPFYVGRSMTWVADKPGPLYLRINDDLLSDNVGQLKLTIERLPGSTPAAPSRNP